MDTDTDTDTGPENKYHVLELSISNMTRPSPIGMKLVPDERSGPRTPWGQVPKFSYRPFFELWPLKVDIC